MLFGERRRVHGAREGLLCVDMSTIAPGDSVELGDRAGRARHRLRRRAGDRIAPKAEDGTLTIMVGGEREPTSSAREPLLEAMGKLIVHAGPRGHGEMVKLLNNAWPRVNARAVGGGAARRRGRRRRHRHAGEVMSAGSGGSAMLDLKAGPMLEHDFTPLFKLDHMLKDVRHCLPRRAPGGGMLFPARRPPARCSQRRRRGSASEDFAARRRGVEGLAGRRRRRPANPLI